MYIWVMEISKELYNEIKEYCDLNGMKTKDYINGLLKRAFMIDKYGECPPILIKKSPLTSVTVEIVADVENETIDVIPVSTADEEQKAEIADSSSEEKVEPKKDYTKKPTRRKIEPIR